MAKPILTPAWKPLIPHPEQIRLVNTKARYVVIPAGRRSGKTLRGKRKIVGELIKTCPGCIDPANGKWVWFPAGKEIWHKWQDSRFAIFAPTREQVERIWWQDVLDLVPPWATDPERGGVIGKTKLTIRTWWGAELRLAGMDKPERSEGSTDLNGCILDEFANFPVNKDKKSPFYQHIQPMLNHRLGWCWFMGVPDRDAPAQVEYEEFYLRAKSGKDPEWATYHWPSADLMDETELAKVKSRMSQKDFEQEYGGQFILAGGRAFPAWDETKHVPAEGVHYDPTLPLCWSLDFNVGNQCSGLIQHCEGKIRVLTEFKLAGSTNMVFNAFMEKYRQENWNIQPEGMELLLYGDPTGSAKDSTSGESDWYILTNRLKGAGIPYRYRLHSKTLSVKDTINAVDAKVENALGEVNLQVDPSCLQLRDDMRTAIYDAHEFEPNHALAYLRYFVDYEYPIRAEKEKPPVGDVGVVGQMPAQAARVEQAQEQSRKVGRQFKPVAAPAWRGRPY